MTDGATGTADLSLPGSGTASGAGAAGTADAGATGSGGGTPAPFDWTTAGLAQEQLNLVTERGWKSPGDVMTSYRHLETATGVPPERLIKLPSAKDANDPKVWNDIYTKLGRPESADKYVIPVPDGDKGEFATAVRPWLHEAGLSQSQATNLATKWNEHLVSTQKAQQAEIEATNTKDVAELKTQWGTDYEARASVVDRAAETFGMKQDELDAFKAVLGPKRAMEFLYNIGSKVAVEDRTVPGMSGQTGQFAMTPEAAQAKIQQLKTDPDYAKLFSSKDPKQRREARDEVSRLTKIAYPGESPVSFSSTSRK